MSLPSYFRFWGKAQPAAEGTPRWHPLAFHSLDVAAVGAAWLEADPRRGAAPAQAGGWDREVWIAAVPFTLALHDAGTGATMRRLSMPLAFPAHAGMNRDPAAGRRAA